MMRKGWDTNKLRYTKFDVSDKVRKPLKPACVIPLAAAFIYVIVFYPIHHRANFFHFQLLEQFGS